MKKPRNPFAAGFSWLDKAHAPLYDPPFMRISAALDLHRDNDAESGKLEDGTQVHGTFKSEIIIGNKDAGIPLAYQGTDRMLSYVAPRLQSKPRFTGDLAGF
jgi:hypothetical protein